MKWQIGGESMEFQGGHWDVTVLLKGLSESDGLVGIDPRIDTCTGPEAGTLEVVCCLLGTERIPRDQLLGSVPIMVHYLERLIDVAIAERTKLKLLQEIHILRDQCARAGLVILTGIIDDTLNSLKLKIAGCGEVRCHRHRRGLG